ncbi:hypothetical protein GJ496_004196 [Pomphorhynchus laevis]|nr:hypothetical protein GJ496_004196 [Pomphorhynchus laevis]
MMLQSLLDPVSYQILSQLKIPITSIFYCKLLRKTFRTKQWISIGLLTFTCAAYGLDDNVNQFTQSDSRRVNITTPGILLLLVYCTASAAAGTLCEFTLKNLPRTSIHAQNAQIYSYSILLNSLVKLLTTSNMHRQIDLYVPVVRFSECFNGFSEYTWILVVSQGTSGLLMSVILKYLGSIVRLYILSLALAVNALLSSLVLGYSLPNSFYVYVSMIIVCYCLYYKDK